MTVLCTIKHKNHLGRGSSIKISYDIQHILRSWKLLITIRSLTIITWEPEAWILIFHFINSSTILLSCQNIHFNLPLLKSLNPFDQRGILYEGYKQKYKILVSCDGNNNFMVINYNKVRLNLKKLFDTAYAHSLLNIWFNVHKIRHYGHFHCGYRVANYHEILFFGASSTVNFFCTCMWAFVTLWY